MTDDPTNASLFGPPAPARLDQLVDRYAHVRALRDFAAAELDRIKTVIGDQADTLEQATGTVFRAPVTGIGQALRTDPQPKAKVVDVDKLAGWLTDNGHDDQVQTRRRVVVIDHDALLDVLGWSGEVTIGIVAEAVRVEETPLLPDDMCTWLTDNGHAVLGIDGLHATADGELIPGTGATQAARRLQVRIDPDYRNRLADVLADRHRPELTEPTDG